MFKNYLTGSITINAVQGKSIHCVLIDSEFEENFIAYNTSAGLDIFTPIVKIYEERNLNVPYNLVKLCSHIMTRFNIQMSLKDYILNLSKSNSIFSKYKKDTEKYFMLL